MHAPQPSYQTIIQSTSSTLLRNLRPDAPAPDDAWRIFLERYVPVIRGYAHARGVDPASADDAIEHVVASFCARVQQGWHYEPGQAPGRFRAYLRAATVRYIDRQRARLARTHDLAPHDDAAPLAPDQLAAIETAEDEAIFDLALERTRQELPPAQFTAWELQTLRAVPAAQIAQQLGISIDLVYQHKSRTSARLRQHVEQLSSQFER